MIKKRHKKQSLKEATRRELITKTKNSDDYKDKSKGRNRYERRVHSSISRSVAQYNRINMDEFFKKDILTVGIEVQGETDDYIVDIKFQGVLSSLQKLVKSNDDKLEFKLILQALIDRFNTDNVFVHCNCPDFKYRGSFYATKDGYNSGPQELRPSNITNPNDTKGAGCKHIALVLNNMQWLMKVASTINNYIKYCRENMQRNYADYIFPTIFGVPYKKAVQLSLFDDDLLPSDQETIDISNKLGRDRGKFKTGNKYRFTKKEKEPDVPLFSKDELNKLDKKEEEKNDSQNK